jgi:hypothetical protein
LYQKRDNSGTSKNAHLLKELEEITKMKSYILTLSTKRLNIGWNKEWLAKFKGEEYQLRHGKSLNKRLIMFEGTEPRDKEGKSFNFVDYDSLFN